MAELPAGTVTFLFTDMEGSTRLLSSLGRDVESTTASGGRGRAASVAVTS